ncbi:MAG: TIGR02281 family clan AA aspartic protease [Rhodospirillales bacterium]|nr:TIGR02281 family clan AA aspartic protease [Alphaproteobacteria bacterium]MBL6958092.1 TIGR02281 family clan AA aspartic protease [Rhodospirillales bacterium]
MAQPSPWSPPPQGPRRRPRGPLWLWLVLAGAVLTGIILYFADLYPEALQDEQAQMGLVYKIGFLALLGGSLIVRIRARPGQALRHASVWLAIGALLLLGYSFRHEAGSVWQRLAGELVPHQGTVSSGAASFVAGRGGHFIVEAKVDGVPIRFLVDTGASDVVLSPADAKRLGFDFKALRFDKVYRTANGQVMGAPVRLRTIDVGPIQVRDVRASVNGAAMNRSLLGMSFLDRLTSYEVRDGRLTLRQ